MSENKTEKIEKTEKKETKNNFFYNVNYEMIAAEEIDRKLNEVETNFINKISKVDDMKSQGVYQEKKEEFKLIPKYLNYIEYMIILLQYLPRVEKFNIGNEYKKIMYETFENIMYVDKVESKSRLYYLNKIDAGLNIQRAYLRIMAQYRWISLEKYNVVMLEKLGEIGRIVGGLVKYYAKNNKK